MKRHLIICGTPEAGKTSLIDFIAQGYHRSDVVYVSARHDNRIWPLLNGAFASLRKNDSPKLLLIDDFQMNGPHTIHSLMPLAVESTFIVNRKGFPPELISTKDLRIIVVVEDSRVKDLQLDASVKRQFDVIEVSSYQHADRPNIKVD